MVDENSRRPVVTVAIPVFNSAATLERCLRSAMAQSLRDIEILVTDDASTDASAELAERLSREDDRIVVVRNPVNGGKPRAMNAMVDRARGDWIAVLDADDAYHPARLARLVSSAEAAGVDMAADNLRYVDAGIGAAGTGTVLRTAFPSTLDTRVIGKGDLLRNTNSFADFDYGILKPVIRREFVERHRLRYSEQTRLAEDFYYLLSFFVAGGRACLLGMPLYDWTLPFGTVSRQWTRTGAGPWRYDYRGALIANETCIAEMAGRGETEVVALLRRRARQYRVMIPYLDAQRHAAEGRRFQAVCTILAHPSTLSLLGARVAGRAARAWRSAGRPAVGRVI